MFQAIFAIIILAVFIGLGFMAKRVYSKAFATMKLSNQAPNNNSNNP